jgi:hypothetical protein
MRLSKMYLSRRVKTGCVCAVLTAFSLPAASSDLETRVNLPWDWSGIIGTGQSLAVGSEGPGLPFISTKPSYGNLKLSTDHLYWPIDPADTNLALVPLVEPVGRLTTNYPSSWPENIRGETPHSAMASEITALVRANLGREFVSIHSAVGEDGQAMTYLKKNAIQNGVNGRSYEAAMTEVKAITRLAKAAGKTYGVGAIIVTHGETDAMNRNYEKELRRLWRDFNTDIPAITGQKQKIQMILSQQNLFEFGSGSTLAQLKVSADYPADMVCSGPKYQYPTVDGAHLTGEGYRKLGEKYGQVYYERVILGRKWQPLAPVHIERNGKIITLQFRVPTPPLVWDTNFAAPPQAIAEWKNGKGFEVSTAGGKRVAIASVAISGDAVVVTCASDPGSGAQVGYAMNRWGLLRDSDPFIGATTGTAQPNYCVAFEMSAP